VSRGPNRETGDARGGRVPDWPPGRPCLGHTELFFPPSDIPGGTQRAAAKAKAMCRTCPIQAACLEYALDAQGSAGRWVDGVWGGTSAKDRDRIRAERAQRDRELTRQQVAA
jgi:WhiB family redox-sensing transcriptional regulator